MLIPGTRHKAFVLYVFPCTVVLATFSLLQTWFIVGSDIRTRIACLWIASVFRVIVVDHVSHDPALIDPQRDSDGSHWSLSTMDAGCTYSEGEGKVSTPVNKPLNETEIAVG